MKKEYVFPFDYKGHFDGIGPYHKHSEGLELRDYFAGQALAGMLADSKTLAAIKEVAEEDNKKSIRNNGK